MFSSIPHCRLIPHSWPKFFCCYESKVISHEFSNCFSLRMDNGWVPSHRCLATYSCLWAPVMMFTPNIPNLFIGIVSSAKPWVLIPIQSSQKLDERDIVVFPHFIDEEIKWESKVHTQTVRILAPTLSLLLDYQESPSEWDVFFSQR